MRKRERVLLAYGALGVQTSSLTSFEVVLSLYRSAAVSVCGRSMLPFVLPGARLVVEPASESDVEVGDVVVFAQDGAWVVHRVVGIDGGRVVTRGDAHRAPDVARPGRRIVARVRGLALGDRAWPVPTPIARAVGRLIADAGPRLLAGIVPAVRVVNGLRYRLRRAAGGKAWQVAVQDAREIDPRVIDGYFRDRGVHRNVASSRAPGERLLVALEHDRVFGSVQMSPSGDRTLVFDLYVSPNARGRSVGTTLLEAVHMRAEDATLEARLRADNTPSRACFARAGFVRVSHGGDVETWIAEPMERGD